VFEPTGVVLVFPEWALAVLALGGVAALWPKLAGRDVLVMFGPIRHSGDGIGLGSCWQWWQRSTNRTAGTATGPISAAIPLARHLGPT